MPLYEHACESCGHQFESLVFGNEKVECPECHSEELERLVSAPAKPKSAASPLPMGCDANLPPCSPTCCRLPQ